MLVMFLVKDWRAWLGLALLAALTNAGLLAGEAIGASINFDAETARGLGVVVGGCAGGLTFSFAIARAKRRHKYATTPGLCCRCGYDLRGIESIRCPECGANVVRGAAGSEADDIHATSSTSCIECEEREARPLEMNMRERNGGRSPN